MTTDELKTYKVTVYILGYTDTDVIERMEDTGNPIDDFIEESIEEVKEEQNIRLCSKGKKQ